MPNATNKNRLERPSTGSDKPRRAEPEQPNTQKSCEVVPLVGMNRATNHLADTSTFQIDSTGIDQATRWQKVKWAAARLLFIAYISFALFSLVGGFLSAPVMTKLFFGDWRFWRHWRRGWRLLPHGWVILSMMLGKEGQFMFSVPLASPPQSVPDRDLVRLSPTWGHGTTCGSCRQCCRVMDQHCPVLDQVSGFCTGYNAFYWRYFNCGRYPSRQIEIDYYGCGKWQMLEPQVHTLNPVFDSNP